MDLDHKKIKEAKVNLDNRILELVSSFEKEYQGLIVKSIEASHTENSIQETRTTLIKSNIELNY